ncbi:MAG TPA: hypothetical protein VFQ53_15045 [Kofleriaceae bacterium]|nr:hypothetical protein [Kofleriaceae bacterium]
MKQLAIVTVLVIGCGDSGSDDFARRASEVEGIYQVQAYTRNETACAPGGTSQLGSETFAFAVRQSFLGQTLLSVMSCASVADCHDKAARVQGGQGVALDFSFGVSEVSGDALVGQGASTGFGIDGVCTGGELTATTLTLDGDALAIEQQITVADDYPVDADGFCTTDAARAAADGNTCTQLELLSATFVEPL